MSNFSTPDQENLNVLLIHNEVDYYFEDIENGHIELWRVQDTPISFYLFYHGKSLEFIRSMSKEQFENEI